MHDAHKQIYEIVTPEGHAIAPGQILRTSKPAPGERMVIFNYPDVLEFVVERLEDRPGWWRHDWLEPQAIVLRRQTAMKRAVLSPRAPLPADHIAWRLEATLEDALLEIPEKTTLHLSLEDFQSLCDSEGIDAALRTSFAAIAYNGLPVKLGNEGDEGSLIDGFGEVDGEPGDYAVIYVTGRDGAPFVIDPVILQTTEQFFAEVLPRARAASVLFDLIVPANLTKASRRALERIVENLHLIETHDLSPRLAAQELTVLKLSLADSAWLPLTR